MANKSKTYLLPYIEDYINLRYISKIEDTFLFYKGAYRFCLQYEFSGKKNFLDYETELMTNEYFVEAVDISKTQVLYVFEIPDELYPIVELFIDGKYSYLPKKDMVKSFLTKHFRVQDGHKIFHILDRSSELRKLMEDNLGVMIPNNLDLSDPPNTDNEEFNIKNNE